MYWRKKCVYVRLTSWLTPSRLAFTLENVWSKLLSICLKLMIRCLFTTVSLWVNIFSSHSGVHSCAAIARINAFLQIGARDEIRKTNDTDQKFRVALKSTIWGSVDPETDLSTKNSISKDWTENNSFLCIYRIEESIEEKRVGACKGRGGHYSHWNMLSIAQRKAFAFLFSCIFFLL